MVTVKVNGLKAVEAKLKAIPANLKGKANQILQNNVLEMAQRAKRDVPVDFGRLKGSITASKGKSTDQLSWSLVAQAAYAPYIEFGTKGRYKPIPGIDPSEFRGTGGKEGGKGFYDSILEWVKRKGISGTYSVKTRRRQGSKIDQQIEDEQVAFAIYLSIIRHGVKPHPFFFKQAPIQEPKINADFLQLVKEVRL